MGSSIIYITNKIILNFISSSKFENTVNIFLGLRFDHQKRPAGAPSPKGLAPTRQPAVLMYSDIWTNFWTRAWMHSACHFAQVDEHVLEVTELSKQKDSEISGNAWVWSYLLRGWQAHTNDLVRTLNSHIIAHEIMNVKN